MKTINQWSLDFSLNKVCLFIFLYSCFLVQAIIAQKKEKIHLPKDTIRPSEKIIPLEKIIFLDMTSSNSIKPRLSDYGVINNKLINLTDSTMVSNIRFTLLRENKVLEKVLINQGTPKGHYTSLLRKKKYATYTFGENGNIDGDFLRGDNYITLFDKGNGYWKDYYIKPCKRKLKEEGSVKNNYKIGNWKYYDTKGNIIKEQKYKLQDSIDVRFPHCLFNKNEPCY